MDQHQGQPGMQGKVGQLPSQGGDGKFFINGPKIKKDTSGLVDLAPAGWVDPHKLAGIADTPESQLQHEGGEISINDLGRQKIRS